MNTIANGYHVSKYMNVYNYDKLDGFITSISGCSNALCTLVSC